MEYRRAYWDEMANQHLVNEHYRRIFPLLKRRYLFSDVEHFELFDLVQDGNVHESAFCYVNGTDTERSLVLYNNQYEMVEGTIKHSSPKLIKQWGSTPHHVAGGKPRADVKRPSLRHLGLLYRQSYLHDPFAQAL